ncbi:unnamed protein product, partial [Polarella glacialis]
DPKPQEEPATLEVSGFPIEASPLEISAAIEASGREVKSVKVLRHTSLQGLTLAKVIMASLKDAQAVIDELDQFEFIPGCGCCCCSC